MNEAKRLSEAGQHALAWAASIDYWESSPFYRSTMISLVRGGLVAERISAESSPLRQYKITPAGRLALNPPTQSHLAGKGEL